jgi:hypothetical protein
MQPNYKVVHLPTNHTTYHHDRTAAVQHASNEDACLFVQRAGRYALAAYRSGLPVRQIAPPVQTPFIEFVTALALAATDHWLAVIAAERYLRDQADSTTAQPTAEVKGEEVAA